MMRVVVREPGGLLGSADRRFQVRALGGPGVQVGDLILGSSDVRGLPVRAAVYATEVIAGVFEAYSRTAAQLENLCVLVELLPFGTTSALTTGRADLVRVRTGGGGSEPGRAGGHSRAGRAARRVPRASDRAQRQRNRWLNCVREVTILAGRRPAAAAAGSYPR